MSGKSNVTVQVPFVADPPLLFALVISPSEQSAPYAAFDAPGGLSRSHAPPIYLANSALRL